MYFAPGATHAPHHVPKSWIEKWKGKFDQGWDKIREETLARQIAAGVVPAGTKLAPKPPAIKDWDKLSADEKRLFARQAEVFAAFVEYTDHEIGRMLKAFDEVGQADNTLVFYIVGDNGTSGEGGQNGMFNEYTYFNGVPEKVEDMLKLIDKWGGPETYPHMAAGWAVALNAPFGWMKQVPSDFGGTRNGMVVSWPKGIKAKNEIRTQFGHVIDVAPTVLQAIGLPEPKVGQRREADPDGRHEPRLHASTTPRRRSATRRSTSRSPATARSTTTAGTRARSTARRGSRSRAGPCRTTRPGSSTTCAPTSASPTTSRRRTRRSSRNCRRSSSRRPGSTTCCRWTTASSSGSTARRSAVPT